MLIAEMFRATGAQLQARQLHEAQRRVVVLAAEIEERERALAALCAEHDMVQRRVARLSPEVGVAQ